MEAEDPFAEGVDLLLYAAGPMSPLDRDLPIDDFDDPRGRRFASETSLPILLSLLVSCQYLMKRLYPRYTTFDLMYTIFNAINIHQRNSENDRLIFSFIAAYLSTASPHNEICAVCLEPVSKPLACHS